MKKYFLPLSVCFVVVMILGSVLTSCSNQSSHKTANWDTREGFSGR